MAHLNVSIVNGSVVARFGELIVLNGVDEVQGIFVPPDTSPTELFGVEVGASMRLSQQDDPVAYLRSSDADTLVERSEVLAREKNYLVTRIDHDGHGMAQVALMPYFGGDEGRTWK